ncbi:hypothetical protein SDRG_17390 [Saprolegnia diclina VS20]|uniref:Myb-like domain-containing protein n=1 Tax=Saprolegnia diclina (strain VS20) TaxID=1156394 RepID=T0PR65_SAPDV|nr:hypothetical protein SDRG_17390 [Saprolegnia diclina VS20]XP_008621870.1 hypothetical protein SDRG_17406 [Saprolegnia diclina VS20]EQC24701.1 hypothetical protein SDRG_17406 [Saprolegnia diclina VS20]EQC24717.1 hypothetical protein SDRG_17390 [Saprolegnia diclina VS20]|eukprot:XP_008621854.1 hypothetical protein SDRG_17390 [Saprolegnia diclina VS20]
MGDEPTKSKKPTYRFSVHTDIDLLEEVINVAPHDAPYGQTTARWEDVTSYMRTLHGEHLTVAGCRKRFDDLMAAFKTDTVKGLRASGTEEEMSQRYVLLEEMSDLLEAAADRKKASKTDKDKKTDKREPDAHRSRAAAQQGLKRKATTDDVPDEDDSAETLSKKSKGEDCAANDLASVLAAFTSMIESTNALKRDEIAAQREAVAVKKEELALSRRKLELEEQRLLFEKAERDERFEMEKAEREAQLEFMRRTIEMMQANLSNK